MNDAGYLCNGAATLAEAAENPKVDDEPYDRRAKQQFLLVVQGQEDRHGLTVRYVCTLLLHAVDEGIRKGRNVPTSALAAKRKVAKPNCRDHPRCSIAQLASE